jgi:type I site-specific restriction endonuclease
MKNDQGTLLDIVERLAEKGWKKSEKSIFALKNNSTCPIFFMSKNNWQLEIVYVKLDKNLKAVAIIGSGGYA